MFRKLGAWLKEMFFTPTPDSPGGDEEVGRIEILNDFDFETELGEFLAHGYEAHYNEGISQGYDDPTSENYDKQVELLTSRLFNRIEREILVKKNKKEVYKSALKKTSGVVKEEIEYESKLIRLENDLEFIQGQKELVKDGKGWFVILEEALHDGFQEGAKKYFSEFNERNEL